MTSNFKDAQESLLALARDLLSHEKVDRIEIELGEDADGDAALFIDVVVSDPVVLSDSKRLLYFKLRSRDRLEELDESRFPIFSFVLAAEHGEHAAA